MNGIHQEWAYADDVNLIHSNRLIERNVDAYPNRLRWGFRN